MYGIQTWSGADVALYEFENDVKMYGIQTTQISIDMNTVFENDVKMYGIQTDLLLELRQVGLRMM